MARRASGWRWLAVLALWLALWLLPWQRPLAALPWIRAALAVAMFIVPGACVQRLLYGSADPARFVALGFAVSMALTGLLGTAARLAHLSSGFVACGLMTLGAAGIALLRPPLRRPPIALRSPWARAETALPLLVALGLSLHLSLVYVFPTDIDFATHHAQVTDFRDAQALGFGSFLFGDAVPLTSPFWLSYWTLGQAVMSRIADLHVIELYPLLKQFVLGLAVLAVFQLARALGLSSRAAGLACVVQLACLASLWGEEEGYRVGRTFFHYTLLDNNVATHVLTPCLVRVVVDYLAVPDRRRLSLVALATLGMLFTHAAMFAFAGLVVGLYLLIEMVRVRRLRPLVRLGLVLLGAAAIPFAFRFFAPSTSIPTTIAEMRFAPRGVTAVGDGRLYGVSPAYAAHLPFLLLGVAGVAAAWGVRRSPAARYVLASLLALALAVVPHTGWLVGSAVTPMLLSRVLWFMPFGIGLAYLVCRCAEWSAAYWRAAPRALPFVASVLSAAWLGLSASRPANDLEDEAYYPGASYVALGHRLDELLDRPSIVVGDRTTNLYLPTLSAKAKNVSHRSLRQRYPVGFLQMLGGFDQQEAARRVWEWQALVEPGTSNERRLELLQQMNARYLVVGRRFGRMTGFGTAFPDRIVLRDRVDGFRIFEIKDR